MLNSQDKLIQTFNITASNALKAARKRAGMTLQQVSQSTNSCSIADVELIFFCLNPSRYKKALSERLPKQYFAHSSEEKNE